MITLEKIGQFWTLFGPNGHQLCDARIFPSWYEAEQWAKNYISSFLGVKLEVRRHDIQDE